jgi:hypothetical protein
MGNYACNVNWIAEKATMTRFVEAPLVNRDTAARTHHELKGLR